MKLTMDINIILIVLYISIMTIIIKILIQRDKKLKLEKYRIDMEYGPDMNIENSLNYIIDTTFDEYRLYNLEFRDTSYIKEVEETKIITDICDMVTDRLSPLFITRLCTYFNESNLGDIIATKISVKVMEYKILNNMPKEQG